MKPFIHPLFPNYAPDQVSTPLALIDDSEAAEQCNCEPGDVYRAA